MLLLGAEGGEEWAGVKKKIRPTQQWSRGGGTLTLFQTKIYDFPYPISDLTPKCIPYFRPALTRNSLTANDKNVDIMLFIITGSVRTVLAGFFFFCNVFRPGFFPICHALSAATNFGWNHTLSQSKTTKSIPYFLLKMVENDTLWGSTYLHGWYMRVPPGRMMCCWSIL